ncbi:MAG TPA: hypothetical protein DCR21_02315 [Succinivibrionaceae bacterium]|nr:superinfection exclusion B family protein [Succinivibrio sp.]HAR79642.1 hypothetical protein [Succinivibrionaceae bacterium]
MDRDFNTNSNALRTLNTIMIWLFCVTVLLLVLPFENYSAELAHRINSNRIFLYLALIFEVSNFISQMLISAIWSVKTRKQNEKRNAIIEHSVESLDFSERALLREYVLQRKSVLNLPLSEPTVSNLIECGILKIVGNTDSNSKTPIIISKYARPFITYKAIGLSCGKMTEDQINQIMAARPEFAKEKKAMPKAYRGARKTFTAA